MNQTKKYSDAFCMLYNEFGWNYYPEIVAEQLLNWFRHDGMTIRSLLDLGCGTGVLCEILQAQGIKAAGADLSEDMIQIARERAESLQADIDYYVTDIVKEVPAGNYDLVTSTGDVMNHIYELRDVKSIFTHVYACMNPGGHFIFDLLNDDEVIDEEPCELDYDEHTRIRLQTTKDYEKHETELTITAYEDGVLTVEEHIRERIHDVDEICALMREVGFLNVCCKDHIDPEAEGHSTSIYIYGRK